MTEFFAKGGQFWLDGTPQLIQAGELHYFRIPRDQWPHRLGLLKQAGFNAVAAYMPWIWHQLEEGVSDFDGHSHPLRDLAGFLDLAAEMGLYIIARPGPYIMAETINEGIPPWVFRNYPQAAFISQDGMSQNIASYLQADFLSCAAKWYRAIFEVLAPRQITRAGRIILVQLDNEMGMIPWVRNIVDINPDTLARFAAYLDKTYGSSLADRYLADTLVDTLKDGLTDPTGPQAERILQDYRRFYREYLGEYAAFLLKEARSNGLEVPPVVNVHGFMNGGKTFPIGLSQLIRVIETDGMITATDVYPGLIGEGNFHQLLMVNAITTALQNREQPLFSIEFQAGGNHDFGGNQTSLYDLHSRLCISSGMRAINHYLFFDGENDPLLSPVRRHDWGHPVRLDGSLRRHYARYPKLSAVLKSYGTDLVLARPQTVTTLGFFLDDFMTEVNNQSSKKASDILTHQREVILFDFIGRGLALTHRPFDAIELGRSELEVSKIPLLWVMLERQCAADLQQKLVNYVKQGGKLVLVGRMCVEDNSHRLCTIMKDALGIEQIEGGQPFTQGFMNAFEYRDVPVSFLETYSGKFDEIFATAIDEKGSTTGFIQHLEKGEVMVLGAAMAANTLGDLDILNRMANKMDCPPLFQLGDWADVRLSAGEKGNFLFVNNYQDDPLETSVVQAGMDLFGGIPLHLPTRRGLILPLEWQLNKNVLLHYSTSEVTGISEEAQSLTLHLDPPEFFAEMTLRHYSYTDPATGNKSSPGKRIKVHGNDGLLVLEKAG